MARFYGKVGFSISTEVKPGVWEDVVTERHYYGGVIRNLKRNESGDRILDNINITNEISIVADPFANENFHHMIYVEFMGALWKISTVTPERPRLILSVGGVYNGEQASTADDAGEHL